MRSLIPFPWSNEPARAGDRDPFTAMQKEINRVFDEFTRGALPSFPQASWAPRIDVAETETAIEVTAELPGLDEKEVDVVLHDDLLTIRGEKKEEKEEKKKDFHLVERSYGAFSRSLRLPFSADAEAVKASFQRGLLKVTIAKPQQVKEKTVKIPVRGG